MTDADGFIRINTEIETKTFDKQIDYLDEKAKILESKILKNKELNIDTKKAEADLERIQNQINDLKNKDFKESLNFVKNINFNTSTLGNLSNIKVQMDDFGNSSVKVNGQLEYMAKNLKDIHIEEEKISGQSKQIKKNMDFSDTQKGFTKLYQSAKKLIAGIIGINTIFSLARKATASYLSTDESLTKQMDANWVALGATMSGIINASISGIKKIITSVLYFAQCLTGVNYIAKANEAILKKQTNATKDLAKANDKLNSSFDEIETLPSINSTSIENEVDTTVLLDVNDLSESARKTIEKLSNSLQPVYKIIKDIVDFCVKNPEVVVGVLGGASLLNLISKLIGVSGAGSVIGSGLSGLLGALLAIASIGVIVYEVKAIYSSVKEAQKQFKITEEQSQELIDTSNELNQTFLDYNKTMDNTTKKGKDYVTVNTALIKQSLKNANTTKELIGSYNWFERATNSLSGGLKAQGAAVAANTTTAYNQLKVMKDLYEQNKLDTEQTKEFKDLMGSFTDTIESTGGRVNDLIIAFGLNEEQAKELKKQYEDVKSTLSLVNKETGDSSLFFKDLTTKLINGDPLLKSVKDSLQSVSDKMANLKKNNKVTLQVDSDTSKASNGLSSFFSNLSSKVSSVFGITFPKIKLASGGIVNNPGRGVSIGNNIIAGEAGAEAVLPLNKETLSELGQYIGKYITVNNQINNYMNGRLINRKNQTTQDMRDFATNK